jgi:NAD(P)H-flavin reductase
MFFQEINPAFIFAGLCGESPKFIMAKQIVEMLVESATMELPDTKTVKLQWPEGYDVDFKTGQFITVYFPDSTAYKRAYSLSSSALDRGFLEVTQNVGDPADWKVPSCL